MDKKIVVVSLSSREPMLMASGYKDGELHIIKVDRLPTNLTDLKNTLPAQLNQLRQNGFIVLVDEVIPNFGQYGRPCRLSDIDAHGKPIVVSALEIYRSMMDLRAITFPSGGGVFEISSSIVDEQKNDRGEAIYKVDWSELKPETFCLLLTIHAAVDTNLYDAPAMEAFLSQFGIKTPVPHHSAFEAITKGYDRRYMSADVFHGDDDE